MKKSPCKKCEDHKTEFPKCLDNCITIQQLQKKHIRSYDYTINYGYCEHTPANR